VRAGPKNRPNTCGEEAFAQGAPFDNGGFWHHSGGVSHS
jgi:hypothetical protein